MSEEDGGWEFALDDLDDDDGEPAVRTDTEQDEDDEDSGGNIAGTLGDGRLEPGTPTGENVFFVVLGATVTLLLFLVVAGVI